MPDGPVVHVVVGEDGGPACVTTGHDTALDALTALGGDAAMYEEVEVDGDLGVYCRNCACDLTDPKNAGFRYDDDWYCSGFCAEVAAGFWARGEDVSDYNSSLRGGTS